MPKRMEEMFTRAWNDLLARDGGPLHLRLFDRIHSGVPDRRAQTPRCVAGGLRPGSSPGWGGQGVLRVDCDGPVVRLILKASMLPAGRPSARTVRCLPGGKGPTGRFFSGQNDGGDVADHVTHG